MTAGRAVVLGVVRAGLLLAWSGSALFVLEGSVPDSPLRLPVPAQRNLVALSPQGWAFFTRDPREPADRVYIRRGATWAEATFTNGSARNLFGLRRDARAVGVELAPLLARVPAAAWSECRGAPADCAVGDVEPIAARNRSRLRRLCGRVLVDRRPPVPWAWSRSTRPVVMPGRFVILDVSCAQGAE